jgi:hypothetical protein
MADHLLAFDDHCVSGVVAALEPHDEVGVFRQQIDNLPFSFIPPLGSDDHDVGH